MQGCVEMGDAGSEETIVVLGYAHYRKVVSILQS